MAESCSIGNCSITCGDDTYGCVCVLRPDGSCSCSCVRDSAALDPRAAELRLTLDCSLCLNVRGIPRSVLHSYLSDVSDINLEPLSQEKADETVDAAFEDSSLSDVLSSLGFTCG